MYALSWFVTDKVIIFCSRRIPRPFHIWLLSADRGRRFRGFIFYRGIWTTAGQTRVAYGIVIAICIHISLTSVFVARGSTRFSVRCNVFDAPRLRKRLLNKSFRNAPRVRCTLCTFEQYFRRIVIMYAVNTEIRIIRFRTYHYYYDHRTTFRLLINRTSKTRSLFEPHSES